jgi:hypothetical protein
LFFGTRQEMEALRPNSRPVNSFKFGHQVIRTKVNLLVPKQAPVEQLDVTAALYEPTVTIDVEDEMWLSSLAAMEVSL